MPYLLGEGSVATSFDAAVDTNLAVARGLHHEWLLSLYALFARSLPRNINISIWVCVSVKATGSRTSVLNSVGLRGPVPW